MSATDQPGLKIGASVANVATDLYKGDLMPAGGTKNGQRLRLEIKHISGFLLGE
jgi:hypothetical protein